MARARRTSTLASGTEEHPMIHPALLHVPTPNWAVLAWSLPYGWYEPRHHPTRRTYRHPAAATTSIRRGAVSQRRSAGSGDGGPARPRSATCRLPDGGAIAIGLRGMLERRASGLRRRVALELTLVASPEPVSFAPPCVAASRTPLRSRTAV
jgi:hypothetical protein